MGRIGSRLASTESETAVKKKDVLQVAWISPFSLAHSQISGAECIGVPDHVAHYFFYTSFIIHLGMFSYGCYPNEPLPYEAEWALVKNFLFVPSQRGKLGTCAMGYANGDYDFLFPPPRSKKLQVKKL